MQHQFSKPTALRFYTADKGLRETSEYQIVHQVLTQLWEGGVIQRGFGYCMSMSDMVKVLLEKRGIKSSIVECKATIMSLDHPQLSILGHDGLQGRRADPRSLDTHLVVVTETTIPMLIDTAVIGIRPDIPWILEAVYQGPDTEKLGDYDFGTSTWVYERKQHSRLPELHQRSITERMILDDRVNKDLKWLKILLAVAMVITLLNAVRGAYDYYQVYIDTGNRWGPTAQQENHSRVERIEQKLDQLLKDQGKSP